MTEMKVYVVNEYQIRDYETVYQDTNVYYHKDNALRKLQDVKEQDFMPVIEDENFEISCDTPTHFEAGHEGEYSRGCVNIEIVETCIMDYSICE